MKKKKKEIKKEQKDKKKKSVKKTNKDSKNKKEVIKSKKEKLKSKKAKKKSKKKKEAIKSKKEKPKSKDGKKKKKKPSEINLLNESNIKNAIDVKPIEIETGKEEKILDNKTLSSGLKAREAIAKIRQYKTLKGIDNYVQGETRITVIKAAQIKKRQLSK